MITSTVWKDDFKLSQESNVTVRQPRKAPITFYIWFNKSHRLVYGGLQNLTDATGGIKLGFA